MAFSAAETEAASEAASRLLNDLGLGACRFSLTPQGDSWLVEIECPRQGEPVTAMLTAEHHQLYASLDDVPGREHLRHEWEVKLADCLRLTRGN